jgi:hypothetical protein
VSAIARVIAPTRTEYRDAVTNPAKVKTQEILRIT